MLKNKKVALYVTGGIAVYKVVDLLRDFIKAGAEVRVAMTEAAAQFVSPLTFQILSRQEVHMDTFSEKDPAHVAHVDLADWADVAVVAPGTANTIAKLASGLADNFVTSALLATKAPIFVVPAMNTDMFENAATQNNMQTLKNRGFYIVDPDTGFLAEGYEGKGRYPENERILEELEDFLLANMKDLPLKDINIVVSAGGTIERIDPVRYITNDSSGKTGHAIAKAAYEKGAKVTLVTTSELHVPKAINKIKVESTEDMYEAIDQRFSQLDILIMSAAVSDYGVAHTADSKMKKEDTSDTIQIELKENPDILKTMGQKKEEQFLVGFAAETENIEGYARGKLEEKNLDMIVANDVGQKDTGFNVDENEVIILTRTGEKTEIPKTSKVNIANLLLDEIIKNYMEK